MNGNPRFMHAVNFSIFYSPILWGTMSESRTRELERSAEQAKTSFHPEEAAQHLSHAFTLFSEEANHLKKAYAKLQEKWLSVNQELAQKVKELERLTVYLNNVLTHITQGIVFIHFD